ncbi:MAG TPA: hypothetical protein VGC16_05750 [Rhizomicrobium sp.]
MSTVRMEDQPRIERLISLAERIIAALESDIAALKDGRTAQLATADPEIQKLTVIYGREAQGFDPRIAQAAPPSLRQRFFAVTAKFREVLQLHARMITRVKNASEGIVRAIATEVERANAPMKTYGPRPGYKPAPPGAMVFNRVV